MSITKGLTSVNINVNYRLMQILSLINNNGQLQVISALKTNYNQLSSNIVT